jgi:benzodiazapine receptor
MKLPKRYYLLFFVLISLLAGFIGSVFTFSAIPTWYVDLNKPTFTPPSWLFGPVWTLLYIVMGVAGYLVWDKNKRRTDKALNLFFIQLGFNALWSILFFGLKDPRLAFFEIVVLWFCVAATTYLFFKIKRTAGYLFVPYLLWVTFASILNFSIVLLN